MDFVTFLHLLGKNDKFSKEFEMSQTTSASGKCAKLRRFDGIVFNSAIPKSINGKHSQLSVEISF